jgi:signal transduction histidine kinase
MSDRPAAEPVAPGRIVWYRSLYWRIAVAFVATVALVLAIQAALFLWLASRTDALAMRPPAHVAAVAASELGPALEADPGLDIDRWLASEYGAGPHRVFVVTIQDRVHRSGTFNIPPFMLRLARMRLRAPFAPEEPALLRPSPIALVQDEPAPAPAPPGGRDRFPRRPLSLQPVTVHGHVTAIVGVLPPPPGGYPLLQRIGPALSAAGLGLLVLGTAVMAMVVFRPVHRRLRALEAAAAAVGAGETAVRAPEDGGDEVASLAQRFNRMAADLDARVRDLQDADRSRRQLLADVSHELMTPLTAMRGYLETLVLPGAVKDEATRARYVGIVTQETLRLEAIVGDLLDLARLEGGGGTLEREPVPLARVFERAYERHEGALAEKAITLERAVAPGAEEIVGDERRLEQVVQNLVANAVRHTPREGRIRVSATAADGAVVVAVEDSGPGIPPEHLDHVFDRFYRVDSSRDARSGGSGLGLSIVRAVVERHGGTVSAATAALGGARFELRFPTS